jgi:hypothetical protein
MAAPSGGTYGIYSTNSGTINVQENCRFFCLYSGIMAGGSTVVNLDRSLLHSYNGAIGTTIGFQNNGTGMGTVTNSIFRGFERAISNSGTDAKVAVYNSTIDTCNYGIHASRYCSAIKNCIISNCSTGIYGDAGGDQPAPDYCNLFNNTMDVSGYMAATHSIDVNPQYTDAANYDYSLDITSTSIDAGTSLSGIVDFDYLGVARPQNAIYDLGAYEHLPAGWSAGNVMGVTPAHIATVLSVSKADIAKILGV